MPLTFNGSCDLTLGVEVELQILDAKTLNLVPKAQEILLLCQEKGLHRVKAEIHQSMLEIDTPICQNVKEVSKSLTTTIKGLRDICRELDCALSISGTHPTQRWDDRLIFPNERFTYLESKLQWLIRRMNVYGMHIHIGVTNGDNAITLLRGFNFYLPLFLALSASSPFLRGMDSGFHSCRTGIIESLPYSGIAPYFDDWTHFEKYYDTLVTTGAIASTKDLYWSVRPNAHFGTLELRVFDGMPTIAEMAALVALTQCLAKHTLDDDAQRDDTFYQWIAPANMLAIARDGLDGLIIMDKTGVKKPVKQQILSCLEVLFPIAQDLGCSEELLFINEILEKGTSSYRQRQVYSKTKNFLDVIDSIRTEFECSCT